MMRASSGGNSAIYHCTSGSPVVRDDDEGVDVAPQGLDAVRGLVAAPPALEGERVRHHADRQDVLSAGAMMSHEQVRLSVVAWGQVRLCLADATVSSLYAGANCPTHAALAWRVCLIPCCELSATLQVAVHCCP